MPTRWLSLPPAYKVPRPGLLTIAASKESLSRAFPDSFSLALNFFIALSPLEVYLNRVLPGLEFFTENAQLLNT